MQTKLVTVCFVAVAATAGACHNEPQTQAEQVNPDNSANMAAAPAPATPAAAAPATIDGADARVSIGGLASCQPSAEVSSLASRAVELADADDNGQVTRAEARSALNLVLGGAFFRADQNGDGKITPEEGREARSELQQMHPALASLLGQARQSTGITPFKSLADLLDIRYGKTLSLADARTAADTALEDLYRLVDTNKDGIISRTEAVQAGGAGAQKIGREAFVYADTNHDQRLSEGEFQAAMAGAAKPLFDMADADHDGKLTEAEAAAASNAAGLGLGMPKLPSGAK